MHLIRNKLSLYYFVSVKDKTKILHPYTIYKHWCQWEKSFYRARTKCSGETTRSINPYGRRRHFNN